MRKKYSTNPRLAVRELACDLRMEERKKLLNIAKIAGLTFVGFIYGFLLGVFICL